MHTEQPLDAKTTSGSQMPPEAEMLLNDKTPPKATAVAYAEAAMAEFPQDDWSPKQIRRYVGHILVTKHDMGSLATDEAAEKWKMGRGRDLLLWDRDSFQKTFGHDVGPHLYRTVYDEEYAHWKMSKEGPAYRCEMTPCSLS